MCIRDRFRTPPPFVPHNPRGRNQWQRLLFPYIGCHIAGGGIPRGDVYKRQAAARFALSILSPSALLIIIPSAISMIPRLIPCNSSPVPASWINRKTVSYTHLGVAPGAWRATFYLFFSEAKQYHDYRRYLSGCLAFAAQDP